MITSARIDALRELNDAGTDFGWITALRAPQIAKLAADDGPLQMSLFDTQDLAEIAHPDYPGERLIACRNPALAAERARKRDDLLAATDKPPGADRRPRRRRQAHRRRRHRRSRRQSHRQIQDGQALSTAPSPTPASPTDATTPDRRRSRPRRHLRATHHRVAADLDAAGVVIGYKNLANVERDFRSIKTDDLDLRPIHHRLNDRVKAHVLICLLACYLIWHLRKAWAPLTFTDEHPPERDNPVAPAQRSADAQAKASTHHHPDGNPLRSFRGLLDHLATLTRNQIRYHGTNTDCPCSPTPPPNNAAPSTSSTPPSHSPPRSQNHHTETPEPPAQPGNSPSQDP